LTDEDAKTTLDVRKFATLVIECGEIIITIVICVLAMLIMERSNVIIYTYNQIFTYNETILGMNMNKKDSRLIRTL